MAERAARRALAPVAVGVLAAAGLAGAFALAQRSPQGPVPVAWDHTTCARCRMLVSDPRFAAQLHAESGEVVFFDDPGCLLAFENEWKQPVRATWFHHLEEDRWVSADAVVFVPADPTPMGYGLGAREKPSEGLSLEAALRAVLARDAARDPVAAAGRHSGGRDAHRP